MRKLKNITAQRILIRRYEVLRGLIEQYNWTYGVELGIRDGATHFYLLEQCPNLKMVGIDIWENNDEQFFKFMAKYKHFENRSQILRMTTLEAAAHVSNNLDFIFIDADHSSEAIILDILTWSPKVKADGWILGHDYTIPRFWSVVRAVDNFFPNSRHYSDNVWGCPKAESVFC